MASLAAIWIVVRVLSWHSPSDTAWHPKVAAAGDIGHQDLDIREKGLVAPPLTNRNDTQFVGRFQRIYLSEHIAPRSTFVAPVAASPVTGTLGLPRPTWQDSEDVNGFFLQASFTRMQAVSGDRTRTAPPFPSPPASRLGNRWAAYLWIYARQGSAVHGGGPERGGRSQSNGRYGGSQAGAILSYRLLDRPFPEISLYGRLSAALNPWSEQEIAVGTRIRPARGLPVAVHAEQRLDASSAGDAGTAVFVTGGTGPDRIVERFALETYAQGGYVFGRNETYFFDGSALLQRPILESDRKRLSVGAGAWAGGQRDITRLDIGPRASLELPLGTATTRIAVDGRVRIAGDARPGSGAALTVSTSF